jgi:hypothetical protein
MIAMMADSVRPGHAMIHHVSMSKALDRVVAMTEGNQAGRARRNKASQMPQGPLPGETIALCSAALALSPLDPEDQA